MAPPLSFSSLFNAVGFIASLVFLFKIIQLVLIYTRPSGLKRYAHPSPSGEEPWALVTGASDGIGNGFSHELAANGFNVVLHGRNHEKLSRVTSELEAAFPQRSFKVLVADGSIVASTGQLQASRNDCAPGIVPVDFTAIEQQLRDTHLTVLVNNAGGEPMDPALVPVNASSELRITANISLNAMFPLHLTRALLPNLMQHQPSLVINIGTMADQGFPLTTAYSASKAFLMVASRALRLEMELEGLAVEILGIRIGQVTGTGGRKEPPSLFVPNSRTMARAALARAAYGNGVVVGYWPHALQQLGLGLFEILPRWVGDKVLVTIMRQMWKKKTQ
jgi:17beta-estradiol 17-dehydrogenase / very-long-chain 3-oxoacyl-CoA reductase